MARNKRIFSPTPWSIQRSKAGPDIYIVNSDDSKGGTKLVAYLKSGPGIMASPYVEGDAILISEAPRMLRRLKEVRKMLNSLLLLHPNDKDVKALKKLTTYINYLENKG